MERTSHTSTSGVELTSVPLSSLAYVFCPSSAALGPNKQAHLNYSGQCDQWLYAQQEQVTACTSLQPKLNSSLTS
ncbi:hypothetical protein WMY93_009528 [Mugilogobius chulae]|uniref:Uncharacterized protein n=1 Tax=Mugilogobius chulae TaxID=88201 RepID=A0AAW0PD45_9GOBI